MNRADASKTRKASLQALSLIDTLCDQFESELEAGTDPQLEEYVAKIDREHQRQLFQELLKIEIQRARQSDHKALLASEYLSRYPKFQAEIQSVFVAHVDSGMTLPESPLSDSQSVHDTDTHHEGDTPFQQRDGGSEQTKPYNAEFPTALTLEQFRENLYQSGLLTNSELRECLDGLPGLRRPKDGEQLARLLVKQKKLTLYQARQIYRGKGQSLVLGNYVILEKLGQGGMGLVLKAEHRRMERLVAIKILSPRVTRSAEALRRFEREVKAAAKLEHPNIVVAYDADQAGRTHFLVMQLVNGADLASHVRRHGPLNANQAISCIIQTARGLSYAHGRGLVHRDIKPANLMLDEDGTVRILDMGLARLDQKDAAEQSELTGSGQAMGTVDYMSPEQALNSKEADGRSDVYSLGITLWFLLTGRVPYQGDSAMARMLAHRESPIPSLKDAATGVSTQLDAIFRRMVAKAPGDRYQTMDEAISELERCESASNAAAASPVVPPPLPDEVGSERPFEQEKDPQKQEHNATAPDEETPVADVAELSNENPTNDITLEASVYRRKHIDREPAIKSAAILLLFPAAFLTLLGLFGVGTTAMVVIAGRSPSEPFIFWSAIYLLVGLVQGVTAIGLLRWVNWARVLSIGFSLLGVLTFAYARMMQSTDLVSWLAGTAVCFYFLYLFMAKPYRVLFSDDYRRAVTQTPHLKCDPLRVLSRAFLLTPAVVATIVFHLLTPSSQPSEERTSISGDLLGSRRSTRVSPVDEVAQSATAKVYELETAQHELVKLNNVAPSAISEKDKLLATAYRAVAQVGAIASDDSSVSIKTMLYAVQSSPAPADWARASEQWLRWKNRQSDGVLIIGRPIAGKSIAVWERDDPFTISVTEDSVSLPDLERVMALGRIVEGPNGIVARLIAVDDFPLAPSERLAQNESGQWSISYRMEGRKSSRAYNLKLMVTEQDGQLVGLLSDYSGGFSDGETRISDGEIPVQDIVIDGDSLSFQISAKQIEDAVLYGPTWLRTHWYYTYETNDSPTMQLQYVIRGLDVGRLSGEVTMLLGTQVISANLTGATTDFFDANESTTQGN